MKITPKFFRVFRDATASDIFEIHNPCKFVLINAICVVDEAAGIRQGNDLATEFIEFFYTKFCYVATA